MLAILFLVVVTGLGFVACQMMQQDGYRRGFADGVRAGAIAKEKDCAKLYALLVGKINVAIGTIDPVELCKIARDARTPDKAYALLARLEKQSEKLLGDLKARAAEFNA